MSLARLKAKARKVKETYFSDFPMTRKFGGDVYHLYKVVGSKRKADAIADKWRRKGNYMRVTYNNKLDKYFIWRG